MESVEKIANAQVLKELCHTRDIDVRAFGRRNQRLLSVLTG